MGKIKIPKPKPLGLQHIEITLKSMGVKFETEYSFSNERGWRFDVAIPERMIAVEYEGIYEGQLKNTKSSGKSRHITLLGYSGDCEKYNAAACAGWRVLRFTSVNYSMFYKFISILIPDK